MVLVLHESTELRVYRNLRIRYVKLKFVRTQQNSSGRNKISKGKLKFEVVMQNDVR